MMSKEIIAEVVVYGFLALLALFVLLLVVARWWQPYEQLPNRWQRWRERRR
jgi:hypothetical protein